MKTRTLVSLSSIALFTVLLSIVATFLNVQIENAKRRIILKRIVTTTATVGQRAFTYVKELYTPKLQNTERSKDGWFAQLHKTVRLAAEARKQNELLEKPIEVSISTLNNPSPQQQ